VAAVGASGDAVHNNIVPQATVDSRRAGIDMAEIGTDRIAGADRCVMEKSIEPHVHRQHGRQHGTGKGRAKHHGEYELIERPDFRCPTALGLPIADLPLEQCHVCHLSPPPSLDS